MNYAKEVNYYLGVNFFKAPIYSNEELKKIIGVNLSELRHLWLFSSKNHFKEVVEKLIHNGVKIDFEKANRVKEG